MRQDGLRSASQSFNLSKVSLFVNKNSGGASPTLQSERGDLAGLRAEDVLEYAGKWLMQSDSVTLSPQKFGAEVHSQETGFPLSRE